ncbi:MAG TPA: anthranilate synthase component I [Gammaproteobacteria bacterium]|nr:anthranilate synthase component I [Gammaproteobacteria bacterium]
MDQQRYDAFKAAGYTRIPVVREVLADLDTPLSTYLKLADASGTFLLESVEGGETWGRYSIIGIAAAAMLSVRDGVCTVQSAAGTETLGTTDPFAAIQGFLARFRVPELPELPRFSGGLVGYFGHETVAYIEPQLAHTGKADELACPDACLMLAEELVIFDNLRGTVQIVVHADAAAADGLAAAERRLDDLTSRLRAAQRYPSRKGYMGSNAGEFTSGFAEAEYCAAVEKVRRYIQDGDAFQVVLSQRLSAPFQGRALDVYRALRVMNPSPYMYHLDFGSFQVTGSSPEVLVRVEDGEVTLRPIAGTRPRGATPEEDQRLAEELLADPKERAEHVMLIDLGRNDVGRVSETGSVSLSDRMVIERYSHVMHIVSEVKGRLREDLGSLDVLKACFPAGTVSGAPKLRALEIIRELEPTRRGIYSGAVGYLAWNGNLDTAIAIRTAVIKDGRIHVQAGAGIVHDSVPKNEWQETLNKARALMRAVQMTAGESGRGSL